MKKTIVTILHHDEKINLNKLIDKLDHKNIDFLLVIVDGIVKIDLKTKIKNKIITRKKSINAIPQNRNIAINFAIKNKFEILIFLDSDVMPSKKLILNHVKAHKKYKNHAMLGGAVRPSHNLKNFNFWEFLDGKLSWFQAIKSHKDIEVKEPYNLPTCNVSIKTYYLKKYKIRFNENLITGEDALLSSTLRKLKLKSILSSKISVIHNDRKKFLDFFLHHMKWGRHQYYTVYQIKFPKNLFYISNVMFIVFFPFLLLIFAFLQSIFVILPWVKHNKWNIFLFPIFIIFHTFKTLNSYIESLKFKYIF